MTTTRSESFRIQWSLKLKRDHTKIKDFMQRMVNRLLIGSLRYGEPTSDQQYYKRLAVELKAYNKTGNCEQLYNIANYALLESIAPSHPKFHLNTSADSVTRSKFGGEQGGSESR